MPCRGVHVWRLVGSSWTERAQHQDQVIWGPRSALPLAFVGYLPCLLTVFTISQYFFYHYCFFSHEFAMMCEAVKMKLMWQKSRIQAVPPSHHRYGPRTRQEKCPNAEGGYFFETGLLVASVFVVSSHFSRTFHNESVVLSNRGKSN